jgi:hypothetical protein
VPRTARRWCLLLRLPSVVIVVPLAALLSLAPSSGSGQEAGSGSALGLSAAAAFGGHIGHSWVERGARALEGGLHLDLGHFSSRQLRLTTDVSYLRAFPFEERVETEGKSYRDVFFDLSGHVALSWYARPVAARVNPFVTAGVGIHVLSSSFQSLTIDSRYNTNNFGLNGGAGVRLRVGERRALVAQVVRVQARSVSRSTLQLGVEALFNDLAGRQR